jgi:hypothetical protein
MENLWCFCIRPPFALTDGEPRAVDGCEKQPQNKQFPIEAQLRAR